MSAFYLEDSARAAGVVDDLLATAGELGMERLPDLSLGAAASAARAAREGDFERAMWALEAAERLDPGRPSVRFAAAEVARLEGDYLKAVERQIAGRWAAFGQPIQGYLWWQDAALWIGFSLLVAAGLFVGIEMALRGRGLFGDLVRPLEQRLPAGVAVTLAAVLLVWPLALPAGVLWLLVYWSVLLYPYGSSSERGVFALLWVLLAIAPLLAGEQRRQVALTLSPPVRAMGSLEARRLEGSLFTDLGVLRSALPDSPAVDQLLADLHRHLGQWGHARALYREVLAAEPRNLASLLDLGAYYYLQGDYGTAVQLFQQAATIAPESAAAYFNLSQAFSASYLFEESAEALRRANDLDGRRVSEWLGGSRGRVVTPDGGLTRVEEIRRALGRAWGGTDRPGDPFAAWRRYLSLPVAAVAAVAALVLGHVRRKASRERRRPRSGEARIGRWRRALLPGVASASAGHGWRAYVALVLPVALATLPFSGVLGYRVPWGYEPGVAAAWLLAGLGFAGFLSWRIRLAMTAPDPLPEGA
jgi:tetratricopeptide (TPR) repeat protein